MKRLIVLSGLTAVGVLSLAVVGAQPDASAMRIERVKDNLYVVTGGRGLGAQSGGVAGNTTVFVANGGVVLIDTKYAGLGKEILAQVKSVTGKPITTIINTHTHGDHTGGNGEFGRTVEFIAHENTKTNMARMSEFTGENAAFLPKKTYKDTMSLLGGTERIDLHYFGAGHTNGDTVIVFPALRTLVIGDLFPRKGAPLIDAANGGSAVAYPQTLAKIAREIKDVDTVITGHATTTRGSGAAVSFVRSAPVVKWADLQEYADFIHDFVAAADAARKAGKSVDDAVGGLKLPPRYKDYDMARAKDDVQRVYEESKR